MESSIRDVDLVNCTGSEQICRELYNKNYGIKNITFITPYIDFKKLKSFISNIIVGERHTVIFSKNEKENKYYFCELGIIEVEDECLITLCEYLEPKLYFDENGDKYNFHDVYVASDK